MADSRDLPGPLRDRMRKLARQYEVTMRDLMIDGTERWVEALENNEPGVVFSYKIRERPGRG